MKYVVIGASPYDALPVYLNDLLEAPNPPDTLVLAEGNEHILRLAVPLAERLFRDGGVPIRVEGIRDPLEALAGADRVLVAVNQRASGRRAQDMASLATVLPEHAAQEAMADLLRTLREGAVLCRICKRLEKDSPEATLLLSLAGAATLVHAATHYCGLHAMGIDSPVPPPLSPQRQQRGLARLAKVLLEGLNGDGALAWRQALSGHQNALMRVALALSDTAPYRAAALCIPNYGFAPSLPRDAVLNLPVQVSSAGVFPKPPHRITPQEEEKMLVQYEFQAGVARAAAHGDRSALREVLEVHPALHGADRLLVYDLMLSLIDAQADMLPQFQ